MKQFKFQAIPAAGVLAVAIAKAMQIAHEICTRYPVFFSEQREKNYRFIPVPGHINPHRKK